jgi:uncharacterized protein YndB with AHSA1/START domain
VITRHGAIELDDDLRRVDRDAVWQYLSTQAYWARWRGRGDLEGQLDGAWRVAGAAVSHVSRRRHRSALVHGPRPGDLSTM